MPQPRKLPDPSILIGMRNKGKTLGEIASKYDVTEGAVWNVLHVAGETNDRYTYKEIVPWEIEPEHRALQLMEQFRRIVRLRHDLPLTDVDKRRLVKWLRTIRQDQVIINYHPDAPGGEENAASPVKGGFYYDPRVAADGDALLRMPAGSETPVVNITDVLDALRDKAVIGGQ